MSAARDRAVSLLERLSESHDELVAAVAAVGWALLDRRDYPPAESRVTDTSRWNGAGRASKGFLPAEQPELTPEEATAILNGHKEAQP